LGGVVDGCVAWPIVPLGVGAAGVGETKAVRVEDKVGMGVEVGESERRVGGVADRADGVTRGRVPSTTSTRGSVVPVDCVDAHALSIGTTVSMRTARTNMLTRKRVSIESRVRLRAVTDVGAGSQFRIGNVHLGFDTATLNERWSMSDRNQEMIVLGDEARLAAQLYGRSAPVCVRIG
jgi:hypothetical protein